ncbi:uncharacterized protein PG998_011395 [Apiospora kogelbergensis]|uniref:uncharacterized protein n=1 Tax=Apiospora kogelbergensis TaxID=1337665 RepID=UPI00312FEA68
MSSNKLIRIENHDGSSDLAVPLPSENNSTIKQDFTRYHHPGNTAKVKNLLPGLSFKQALDHLAGLYENEQNKHHKLELRDNPSPQHSANTAIPILSISTDQRGTQTDESKQEKDTQIKELEAIIQAQKAALQENEITIQKQEDRLQVTRQKWQEAEIKLSASSNITVSEDIDDEMVIQKMNVISTRIQLMAKSYFSGKPMTDKVKTEHTRLFDKLAMKWGPGYLKDAARKQFLIEAVIWLKATQRLFCRPLAIWCEQLGTSLKSLHMTIYRESNFEKMETYHSTRIQQAELLKKVRSMNGDYLGNRPKAKLNKEAFVDELRYMLDKFAYNNGYLDDLRTIIDHVVDLAYYMAMAKAHYSVRIGVAHYDGQFHGFRFDPDSMQAIHPGPGPGRRHLSVALVASPALIKRGTSKGEDYDSETILTKARVICEEEESEEESDSDYAE